MLRVFGTIALTLLLASSGESQSRRHNYTRAEAELQPFLNTEVFVRARFVESFTPEKLTRTFGNYWVGCPQNSLTSARNSMKVMFAVAPSGRWVNYDGIQVSLARMDGTPGSSLLSPSDSTMHVPGEVAEPKMSAWFDFDLLNVRRNLIDAAAEEFDRCYASLPRGSYSVERLLELCPIRRVNRTQQGQTCLVSMYMDMRGFLDSDGSVPVTISESTSCDFVGNSPELADITTSFSTCFSHVYSGRAYFGDLPRAEVAAVRSSLAARQRALRRCASGRSDMASIQRCVVRQMARSRGSRDE